MSGLLFSSSSLPAFRFLSNFSRVRKTPEGRYPGAIDGEKKLVKSGKVVENPHEKEGNFGDYEGLRHIT